MEGAAAALHPPSRPSLASFAALGAPAAVPALLLACLLGVLPLLLAGWLTPGEANSETPSSHVVLALRRKLPSSTDTGTSTPDEPT
jgi:hypothetical protein